MTVRVATLASSGSSAITDDGRGDVVGLHRRLGAHAAVGLQDPLGWLRVISVAALPMSICPQAMSYPRPSREVALVSPVIACLVAV